MSTFGFLKKIKEGFLLFTFFSVFCEDDFFRVSSNVSLNGSVFVEGSENLTGKLECGNLRLLFGNFSNNGNFFVDGDLSLQGVSSVGSFTLPNFSAESLVIKSLNLNLGVNSVNEIKIGNASGKDIHINSSLSKGVFIGDQTDEIMIGNENGGDISISAEKQNNGKIKFKSKTLNFDVSDFVYPENDDLKLLRIDASGVLTTDDNNLSLPIDQNDNTIIPAATFDNLSSMGEINFLGQFNTNENSIVHIGNGTGDLKIGDENSETVKFIGQWDIAGNEIQIGSLINTETIIGDSSKENIVRLGQYLTDGSLYLEKNDLSIIFPEGEGQYFLLKIKDDGSIFTELPGDQNRNYSYNGGNFESNGLEFMGNLYVVPDNYFNVGNSTGGTVSINSGSLLSIGGGDIILKGVGLKMSGFDTAESGTKYLMIDEEGLVKILNAAYAHDLNIANLTVNGPFTASEGRVRINQSGNSAIKIANTDNTGIVSIGNGSSGELILDATDINLSAPNILVGNFVGDGSNGDYISKISISSSDTITFSTQYLYFGENGSNNNNLALVIDSEGRLSYKPFGYYDADNSLLNFSNLNLNNCDLAGYVEIGNSDSNVDISGATLKIGDQNLTDTITIGADMNLVTKSLTLDCPEIIIGEYEDSIVNIGSFQEDGKLGFLFDKIILPDSSLYNYNLFIDEDGNVITKELLKSGITGDTEINKTGSYNTYIGNSGAGEIVIRSSSDTTVKAQNVNLIATGSIYPMSIDIEPSEGNIPFYVNQNGRLTTDEGLTRNSRLPSERIENLNLSEKSVKSLSPKVFIYIDNKLRGDSEDAGFIAEELLNTDFENCVIKDNFDNVIAINYDGVFCGICSSYKSFISKVEKLKNRISKSKQKVLKLLKGKSKKKEKLG